MKTGILRKMAVVGIAMLMLIALASNIGQARNQTVDIKYKSNYPVGSGPKDVTDTVALNSDYQIRYNINNTFFAAPAGYVFAGWNTKSNGSGTKYTEGQIIKATAGFTLWAQWTKLPTYTITYKSNYPVGVGPKDVTDKNLVQGTAYQIRYNINDAVFATPAGGYTFLGWNTQANGTGTSYAAGDIIKVSANLTLFAQWTTPKFTFTYKSNYPVGTGAGPADVIDRNIDPGSAYQIRYNINDSLFITPAGGYKFAGWNTQANGRGSSYTEGQIITANANLTLFAQWTVLPKFTVTYKSNYPGGPADKIDANLVQGDAYQIKYNINDAVFATPAGQTFIGWNTRADGTGTSYAAGDIIKVSANLTLFAQWTPPPAPKLTGVDGRILSILKSGDSSNWIEIAQYGKYSLIVRSQSVYCGYFCDPKGIIGYSASYVRAVNNTFFNIEHDGYSSLPSGISLTATLPKNARLRSYTMQSDAMSKLGTCYIVDSLSNGYSHPTNLYAPTGVDICFALSFTEAANFISNSSYLKDGAMPASPAIAKNNYSKIVWTQPSKYIWLRSPGAVKENAGAIWFNDTPVYQGMVAEIAVDITPGNCHPALWVDSAIFN